MPSILLRPRAKADLGEIWGYIADDSETRADAFIVAIEQKLRLLARQPSMGRKREILAAGLRSFPVGRYVIFYRSIQDGIDVIRVLHGSRDLEAIFGAEDQEIPNS